MVRFYAAVITKRRVMQSVVELLEHSRSLVKWFATGEAVRLERKIRDILEGEASESDILETAILTANFLTRQGAKESQSVGRELYNRVHHFRLGGSI
jgi:hypothetical protein